MKSSKLLYFIIILIIPFLTNCKNNPSSNKTIENEKISDTIVVEEKNDFSEYNRNFNDLALWLAGMEQDSAGIYKHLENSQKWKDYCFDIKAAFDILKVERIGKLDTFRINELSELNKDIKTLFYPYSGPDFVHADIFFPNAEKIIMIGLEHVGDIPDFSNFTEYNKQSYFSQILTSLGNVLSKGYFITKRMKNDFASEQVDSISGVMPIFYVFMAQSDCRILDSKKITIDKNGNVIENKDNEADIDDPWDNFISGLQIDYVKKDEDKIKTVMYFSQDIGDPKLDTIPEFMTFLDNQEINVTFLKAASYLNIWFAKIRNFTLENSDYIFQDDSGIPIRYINDSIWDIKLYGEYTRTLEMFKDYFQSQLRNLYNESDVTPLDFGIGYNGSTIDQPNLQLFIKKKE